MRRGWSPCRASRAVCTGWHPEKHPVTKYPPHQSSCWVHVITLADIQLPQKSKGQLASHPGLHRKHIIIITMEWRTCRRAWLFPRHSSRWNDRPHAGMLYGSQSWVAWDQLLLFVAKTGVDDLLDSTWQCNSSERTDGSSQCVCTVLSRFCSGNMAKQL